MAKTKLTVTTDAGTFTRTTARTYAFIVVLKGERHELLEAERKRGIAHALKNAARYAATQTSGIDPDDSKPGVSQWSKDLHAEWVAKGQYGEWAANSRDEAAELEARGPVTADAGDTFGILGWCGRLDLAVKLAATDVASRYREVRIYALDGTRVR
jgi:hypothetical protein